MTSAKNLPRIIRVAGYSVNADARQASQTPERKRLRILGRGEGRGILSPNEGMMKD
jgi:hypothetical protein